MDEPDYDAKPPPGYVTQSPDTAYWAEKLLFDRWRELEPWEKAAIADDLTRFSHQMRAIGLRQRYPTATQVELDEMAARERLGDERWGFVVRERGAERAE